VVYVGRVPSGWLRGFQSAHTHRCPLKTKDAALISTRTVRMRSPMSKSNSRLAAKMGNDKRSYLSFYHLPILHSQGLDRRVQNFTEGPPSTPLD